MPHVPCAKCSDRPEFVTRDCLCLFSWLGNGLSSFQHARVLWLRPAHCSRGRDEAVPGAWVQERGAAPSRPAWPTGPVTICSLAEASLQLPFCRLFDNLVLERKLSKWQKPEVRRMWQVLRSFLLGYAIKRNSLPSASTNCSQERDFEASDCTHQ